MLDQKVFKLVHRYVLRHNQPPPIQERALPSPFTTVHSLHCWCPFQLLGTTPELNRAASHKSGRFVGRNLTRQLFLLVEDDIHLFKSCGACAVSNLNVVRCGIVGFSCACTSHTLRLFRWQGIIKMQYKTNSNRRSRLAEAGAGSLTQSLVRTQPRSTNNPQLPYELDPDFE